MGYRTGDVAAEVEGERIRDEHRIFRFEADFARSLRCIPMAVRFKLDRCGVKLSLKQWSRFLHQDRLGLASHACDTAAETEAYRDRLVRLVATRSGDPVVDLPIDPDPDWSDVSRVPDRLMRHATSLGLSPPTPGKWARLSSLQRFALLKLARDNHDNANFLPAMHEFGLLD